MLSANIFNTIFVFPILNLLVAFYKLLLYTRIPGAFGLSIVALVVLIRLVFHPFFKKQLETTKKMQELKPHLDKLSTKHKGDAKKLQQEQMRLYQEAGINPAAGCIFMLIQIPVFIALYQTLSLFLTNGNASKVITRINEVVYSPLLKIQHSIDPHFLGLNLILSPAKAHIWFYYLIPVITGILQYLQVSATAPAPPPAQTDKKDDGNDFQRAMSTQMKYVFPFMIGWFSYSLPIGLSLYWNIFSLFSIMQYRRMNSNPPAGGRNTKQIQNTKS